MRKWTQEVKQEVSVSVKREIENEYRKNASARRAKENKEEASDKQVIDTRSEADIKADSE
jgi:hypothetical protein